MQGVAAAVIEGAAIGGHVASGILGDPAIVHIEMMRVDVDRVRRIPKGDPIIHGSDQACSLSPCGGWLRKPICKSARRDIEIHSNATHIILRSTSSSTRGATILLWIKRATAAAAGLSGRRPDRSLAPARGELSLSPWDSRFCCRGTDHTGRWPGKRR